MAILKSGAKPGASATIPVYFPSSLDGDQASLNPDDVSGRKILIEWPIRRDSEGRRIVEPLLTADQIAVVFAGLIEGA